MRNIAALSMVIGYPTAASAPHCIANGFKRLLAIAVETDYSFPEAEKVKFQFEVGKLTLNVNCVIVNI